MLAHVFYLEDLNDLKLGVHDQNVLFLRFGLGLDRVPTGAVVRSCGKEASSSQNYLGH